MHAARVGNPPEPRRAPAPPRGRAGAGASGRSRTPSAPTRSAGSRSRRSRRPPGDQAVRGQLEEALEHGRRQVLDHLRGEDGRHGRRLERSRCVDGVRHARLRAPSRGSAPPSLRRDRRRGRGSRSRAAGRGTRRARSRGRAPIRDSRSMPDVLAPGARGSAPRCRGRCPRTRCRPRPSLAASALERQDHARRSRARA